MNYMNMNYVFIDWYNFIIIIFRHLVHVFNTLLKLYCSISNRLKLIIYDEHRFIILFINLMDSNTLFASRFTHLHFVKYY